MKEETNNEIDLLLRRLGRRPDISVSEGNGDVDHLDADELNAFAENVLPAAARARYTGHLAECARCRELVVQLSSSAAVVPVVETVKTPAPSALRKFLSSLFSPMVLRYAVPALGLIVVAAIGIFVLRQKQSDGDSIAKNAEAPAPESITTPPAIALDGPASKTYVEPKPEADAKPAQRSSSAGNEAGAAAGPQATPVPEAPADSSRQAFAKEPQPVTAAAPPPKPAVADTARENQAKTESPSPQGQAANEPPAERAKAAADKVRVEERKEAEIATTSSSVSGSVARKGTSIGALSAVDVKPRSQRDDAAEKDKKNDAESETKTVAGRKFRKRGGVWIDTAYDSARAVTEVSRGSEQYRALIADEPGIKTIADQLDGEIVLVWKGRPYHIR